MSDRRYKTGLNRQQTMLLPPSVDEYVSETNTVRAVDAYVNTLDLERLGFTYTDAASALGGQPAFPPSALLKLYLYGYLNRIRSSRRLAREACRNLELIWLLQGFEPSHATIANFRKDNLDALKKTNRDFIEVCRELKLFGGEEVGIDGTFMQGNASKASIHREETLRKQAAKLEKEIDAYLAELERNDRDECDTPAEDAALAEKIERLRARQAQTQARLAQLEQSGATQLSETDPDARLLTKRGHTIAGYNVQIAVDAAHKLIVCHEVVNDGNDSQQLAPMAIKTKEILEVNHLVVDADAGYDNQEQIKTCVDTGITPYVPLADKDAQTRQAGRFVRGEFTYDAQADCYRCPMNQILVRQGSLNKNGKQLHKYASKASVCDHCEQRVHCLPDKTPYRQLYRWEHEEIIEAHRERMRQTGREHMKTRAALAEHPFGTLKNDMGWQHFLMRGLAKVRAEMALQVLGYNFKRVLNIIGIDAFAAYLEQRVMAW